MNTYRQNSELTSNQGLSMVELMIATLAVMIGLSAFLRSIVGSLHLARNNRNTAIAAEATRGMVERLRSEDPSLVFAMYNGDVTDDPVGGAPGRHFAVEGLRTIESDADGFVGEILFPTPTPDSGRLVENPGTDFPDLPRDMNLDGDATDVDVSADYQLLPVILRLQWRGAQGDMTYEVSTLIGAR
jgi:hypothetical protein